MHMKQRKLFYRRRSAHVDPYPWDPRILPSRNCQPNRALEQLAKGTAEQVQRQNSAMLGCHTPRCIIYVGLKTFLWNCAPVQKKIMGLGTKERKKWFPLQLLLVTLRILCASYLHNSELCIVRGSWSLIGTYFCQEI